MSPKAAPSIGSQTFMRKPWFAATLPNNRRPRRPVVTKMKVFDTRICVRLERRGARLGLPSRNCRLREPHRQAPALAQGGIVFGPVRDPAPLLGDMMAARGIGL